MNISEALHLLENDFSCVKLTPRSVTLYKWQIPEHRGKTLTISARSRKGETFESLIIRAVETALKKIATGDLKDPWEVKTCEICGAKNQWPNRVTKKGKKLICDNCRNPKTNVVEITAWQNKTIG